MQYMFEQWNTHLTFSEADPEMENALIDTMGTLVHLERFGTIHHCCSRAYNNRSFWERLPVMPNLKVIATYMYYVCAKRRGWRMEALSSFASLMRGLGQRLLVLSCKWQPNRTYSFREGFLFLVFVTIHAVHITVDSWHMWSCKWKSLTVDKLAYVIL